MTAGPLRHQAAIDFHAQPVHWHTNRQRRDLSHGEAGPRRSGTQIRSAVPRLGEKGMKIAVTGGSGFIGTNLIEALLRNGDRVLNLDVCPPKKAAHQSAWARVDVACEPAVREAIRRFAPEAVVHLAARADMAGKTAEDYAVNYTGTETVIAAIRAQPSVGRLVHVSSQFVHQGETPPTHDEDYAPHTPYGESKVRAERAVRDADLDCTWVVVRPTNVWGPWHPRYPSEAWRVIRKGLYLHPGRARVLRSYGYVGNVVDQLVTILRAPRALIDRKLFYVGDEPIDVFDWVDGFAHRLNGRGVRVAPRPLVWCLAVMGEACQAVGVRFPITLARYQSMITDNPAPMGPTFEAFGVPRYALAEGIEETVDWLRDRDPDFWGGDQGRERRPEPRTPVPE